MKEREKVRRGEEMRRAIERCRRSLNLRIDFSASLGERDGGVVQSAWNRLMGPLE